jgi:hypothetical protein
MLILFNSNDGLQIRLGAVSVSPLQIVGSYRGVSSTAFNPRAFGGQTNGTTAVEVLSGDGTEAKVIDWLSIRNGNVANAEVVIDLEIAGTLREFMRVILAQGERLQYQEGTGWQVFTVAGALKTSLNQGTNVVASGDSVMVLGADVTNNNATANTIADVTGLSFPVETNTRYWFEFVIRYTAAATTTGSRWSINSPSSNELTYDIEYSLSTTSKTFIVGLTAVDLPAASNASSASVLGNIAKITGFIRPTANGSVIARFASEIAGSAIIAKAGSFVRYRAL